MDVFMGVVAIGSIVIVIIVHISFAIAVFRDATYLPSPRKSRRQPIPAESTIR